MQKVYLKNSSALGGDHFLWLTYFLVTLPSMVMSPLIYSVFFNGNEIAFRKIDCYVVYLKGGITIIVIGLLYSIRYPNEKLCRRNVRSNVIPSGWIPGIASRYVNTPYPVNHIEELPFNMGASFGFWKSFHRSSRSN